MEETMTETLYPHEVLVKYFRAPSPIHFIISQFIATFLVLIFVMLLIVIFNPHPLSPVVISQISLGLNFASDLAIINCVTGIISFWQFAWRLS